MSFNITPRESISRCEVYDNKFRFYPEETRLKETRLIQARDRIESPAERLERQMTDKLSKGVFQPEGATTQYIKKVGKFIFVAVINPPYYLAIKAPQWLLQQIGPALGTFTGTLFGKLGSFLNASAELMGLIALQFSKLFNLRLKKTETTKKSSRDFPFKRQLQTLFSSLQKRALSALAPVERALERMSKKGGLWLQKLLSYIEKAIAALKPYLPKVSIKLPKIDFKRPLLKVRAKIPTREALLETLQKGMVRVKGVLKELALLKEIFPVLGKFFGDIIETNYRQWIEPYFRWVGPFMGAIYSKIQKGARYLGKGVSRWSEGCEGLFSKCIHRVDVLVASLSKKIVAYQKKLSLGFEKVLLKVMSIKNGLQNGVSKLVKKVVESVLSFKQSLPTLIKVIKKVPQKLFVALDHTAELMISGAQKLAQKSLKGYLFLKVFTKLFLKTLFHRS